jgi:2,4-dienoyl-CoA reductase-like NADH-dependent reductase (Old Yellow Enzyme family)
LTQEEIKYLVDCFVNAARRAKESGFDAIEIHSAHGYLLSQFLSPFYNKRIDEYGGGIDNRSRIHLEILKAIRAEVGANYPVLIKLNCQDFDENGLNLEDAIRVGKLLAQSGLDAIELSGGLLSGRRLSPSRSRINTADDEAYFREQAKAFKKEIGIPLILVGGIRSLEVANDLVTNGTADYLAMSRPLIREPDLINRWKSGQVAKAACKSDNLCFGAAFNGGVYCVSEERDRSKKE